MLILKNINLNIIYCNHFWQLKNFFTEFQLFQFAYLINSPIISIVPKSQIISEELGHIWRQQSFFKKIPRIRGNHTVLCARVNT